jgi:hypothetical protein
VLIGAEPEDDTPGEDPGVDSETTGTGVTELEEAATAGAGSDDVTGLSDEMDTNGSCSSKEPSFVFTAGFMVPFWDGLTNRNNAAEKLHTRSDCWKNRETLRLKGRTRARQQVTDQTARKERGPVARCNYFFIQTSVASIKKKSETPTTMPRSR